MNVSHSDLTDWGLAHISVDSRSTVLDVGCGGGRTLGKLAIMAAQGKVYGVDFSEESVAASKRTNARAIKKGLVEVRHGSVSQLPFPDNMFDLVTAVETHFWWPNLDGDVREVFRVVKPGGTFVVIAEVYKGANTAMSRKCEEQAPQTGMIILDIDGHREMLAKAGFRDVKVTVDPERGWICATGNK
jgi:ubiquinone/menaquinone biosynthesis C-methylase UbiE